MNGLTLDAGGLIALERRDRRMTRLLERAFTRGWPISVPATVLAQAVRDPARQTAIARLLKRASTTVVPLDVEGARNVGILLAKTGTNDIADAHVVICAQRLGYLVVTSDPADIRRLDPALPLFPV